MSYYYKFLKDAQDRDKHQNKLIKSCFFCLLVFITVLHIFVFPNSPQLVKEIELAGRQSSGAMLFLIVVVALISLILSERQSSTTRSET